MSENRSGARSNTHSDNAAGAEPGRGREWRRGRLSHDTILWFTLVACLFAAYLVLWAAGTEQGATSFVTVASDFRGPVSRTSDGSLLIRGLGDQFSIAWTNVRLKKNRDYRVEILAEGTPELHVDLWQVGYDSIRQEFWLLSGPKAGPYSYTFNSEDIPPIVTFRLFFVSKDPIVVHSLRLVELSARSQAWKWTRRILLDSSIILTLLFVLWYRKTRFAQALALFLFVLTAYRAVHIPDTQNNSDNFWYVPTAASLLSEGNIELSEYAASIGLKNDRRVLTFNDKYYNFYPPGTSFVIVPFVFVFRVADGMGLHLLGAVEKSSPTDWLLVASAAVAKLFAALSVALMFLVACRLTNGNGLLSVFLALAFGFGTSHFSVHAGGLWSHNTAVLMFLLALLALLSSDQFAWLAAIPLSLGYMMRPDFAIVILALSAYVLIYRRQVFLLYALVGAALALGYFAFSLSVYGRPLPPYYELPLSTYWLWTGLAGTLISPNRGLLVFSPIFLLSIYGMYLSLRRGATRPHPLHLFLTLIVLVHWISLCISPMWWGGYSYGPRLFASILPALVLLLIPVFQRWAGAAGRTRFLQIVGVGLLLACSFFTHFEGATQWETQMWNVFPTSINEHPDRLWDWRDWQPLRGQRGK